MKHLKKFEGNLEQADWNKRIKNFIEERKVISELLEKYVAWKVNIDKGDEVIVTNFYFRKGNIFVIRYDTTYGESDKYFETEDYEELLQFMDDPEFVMSTKKFNL